MTLHLQLLHSGVDGPLGLGVSSMGLNYMLRWIDVFIHELLKVGY